MSNCETVSVEEADLDSISERCIQQAAYRWAYTDGEFFRGKA